MDKKPDIEYDYMCIDGAKELNSSIIEVCEKYKQIALDFYPNKRNLNSFNVGAFYVDMNETQPENGFYGYFFFGAVIFRFLRIYIDYVALFPFNHFYRGKLLSDIERIKNNNRHLLIYFKKDPNERKTQLHKEIYLDLDRYSLDDIGSPYMDFNGINELSIIDIPRDLLSVTFTLIDQEHIVPFSIDNIDCVLVAEESNVNDSYPIKVLRWHPQLRYDIGLNHWGDYFFELGYVSQSENKELHSFMMHNNSRMLFGKIMNKKITLLGSVKMFLDNNIHFPLCLSKIKIL